jgi:hypothetical protein
MLQYLETFKSILPFGVTLERKEVIRRYRSLKNFNRHVLNLLCMTDFFMLCRNEKGEMFIV